MCKAKRRRNFVRYLFATYSLADPKLGPSYDTWHQPICISISIYKKVYKIYAKWIWWN